MEIAPGVDLEKDILAHMDFRPLISPDLCLMDARIFQDAPMALRQDIISLPLEQRLYFDPEQQLFFVNFAGLTIRSAKEIERIRQLVNDKLAPLGHKVPTIVNYDNFSIHPELLETHIEMVRDVTQRYYSAVTRFTTSAFMRAKLGDALTGRDVSPHIYESSAEALKHLQDQRKHLSH